MGSLSKNWTAVESATLSQEDSVEVDLNEFQEFVEQTAGTSIKFLILLQKIFLAIGTNRLTTAKNTNIEGTLITFGTPPNEKKNLGNIIGYIPNKIQTLSPRSSPDTEGILEGKNNRRFLSGK